MSKEFGVKLDKILKDRRIRQVEVARELGVSPQAVNSWVKGENEPIGERFRFLCAYLKINESYFNEHMSAFYDQISGMDTTGQNNKHNGTHEKLLNAMQKLKATHPTCCFLNQLIKYSNGLRFPCINNNAAFKLVSNFEKESDYSFITRVKAELFDLHLLQIQDAKNAVNRTYHLIVIKENDSYNYDLGLYLEIFGADLGIEVLQTHIYDAALSYLRSKLMGDEFTPGTPNNNSSTHKTVS